MAEYIERTALRDALYSSDAITMRGVKILNQFPAADVAPVRHARWEVDESGFLKCTNCAWVRHGVPLVEHYPYCPNCGARMDGGTDNG